MGQVPGIGASVWDAARAAGSAPAAGFLSFETPLRGWNPFTNAVDRRAFTTLLAALGEAR